MAGDIIAIGGGGFGRNVSDLRIETYLLSQLSLPTSPSSSSSTSSSASTHSADRRTRVGFLPQASCEDASYINRFYQAFSQLGAEPTHVSLFGVVKPEWRERLLDQDMIYVGGGNTRSMIALWREWAVDDVLREAHERGILLCGVSAGAICWFEQGVTDSVWPLGSLPCLGFLTGSACPHYDGEVDRKPGYDRLLADGLIQPGVAIDDLAAAHYRDDRLFRVIAATPTAGVYQVDLEGACAVEDVERIEL